MYGPNTKSVDLTSLNLPEDKNANLNDIINISNDYDFGEFFQICFKLCCLSIKLMFLSIQTLKIQQALQRPDTTNQRDLC